MYRAVIWHHLHRDGEPCGRCPVKCMALSVMRTLIEVATHPGLLQIPPQYAAESPDNPEHVKFKREFLSKAVPLHILEGLGGIVGRSRFTDGILSEEQSGKMITLKQLLGIFCEKRREKVLVFSQWTRMLDIIEAYVKCKGSWSYRRLDGDTAQKDRQRLVDEFNNNASIMLFLLSTKAGGLGLNLKAASKVIVFDMNWNPTSDQQAQDRSYRYGQTERVTVYRLVAKGTIEEVGLVIFMLATARTARIASGKRAERALE